MWHGKLLQNIKEPVKWECLENWYGPSKGRIGLGQELRESLFSEFEIAPFISLCCLIIAFLTLSYLISYSSSRMTYSIFRISGLVLVDVYKMDKMDKMPLRDSHQILTPSCPILSTLLGYSMLRFPSRSIQSDEIDVKTMFLQKHHITNYDIASQG